MSTKPSVLAFSKLFLPQSSLSRKQWQEQSNASLIKPRTYERFVPPLSVSIAKRPLLSDSKRVLFESLSSAFRATLSSSPSTTKTSSACRRLSETRTPSNDRICSIELAGAALFLFTRIFEETFVLSTNNGEWVVITT